MYPLTFDIPWQIPQYQEIYIALIFKRVSHSKWPVSHKQDSAIDVYKTALTIFTLKKAAMKQGILNMTVKNAKSAVFYKVTKN